MFCLVLSIYLYYGFLLDLSLAGSCSSQTNVLQQFSYQSTICISIHKAHVSWFEAKRLCIQDGGDLVSVTSSDLHTAIVSKWMGTDFSFQVSISAFWIGLTRIQWTWVDGKY